MIKKIKIEVKQNGLMVYEMQNVNGNQGRRRSSLHGTWQKNEAMGWNLHYLRNEAVKNIGQGGVKSSRRKKVAEKSQKENFAPSDKREILWMCIKQNIQPCSLGENQRVIAQYLAEKKGAIKCCEMEQATEKINQMIWEQQAFLKKLFNPKQITKKVLKATLSKFHEYENPRIVEHIKKEDGCAYVLRTIDDLVIDLDRICKKSEPKKEVYDGS